MCVHPHIPPPPRWCGRSFEETCLWPLLSDPPEGMNLDFVKAELSNFHWEGQDEQMITELGHRVHLLENAGHWVRDGLCG